MFVVVMVALIVAIWPRGDDPAPSQSGSPQVSGKVSMRRTAPQPRVIATSTGRSEDRYSAGSS